MIAVVIFMGGLIFFYYYSSNTLFTQNQQLDDLSFNAKLVSSYLVSTGYPVTWNSTNVNSIGLTDGNLKLSPTKVGGFANLTYLQSRQLLSTKYDFLVNFKDQNNNPVLVNNVSSIGRNYSLDNPENLLSLNRFVFYNSTIIRLEVIVW